MKQAQVVIGSGFGDEGKGLATDFYAAHFGKDALVVRFNGGAQAGHTVVTPEGQRHIFSHIGSGSMVGAATYLSRFLYAIRCCFSMNTNSLTPWA
ncbi:MAG: adenylosuccinate synthetase [Candidatus Competibacteraceae bacterium]|nr:adenylosuccinate synthetase [Candidatus Competibacteraceae bacterium]